MGISSAASRAFDVLPLERIGLVLASGAILFTAGSLDSVWLIVILDVFALIALMAEHYRIEVQPGDSVIHHAHD